MEPAFHPEALAEFKASVTYYEKQQTGLGLAFADEVFRLWNWRDCFPKSEHPRKLAYGVFSPNGFHS